MKTLFRNIRQLVLVEDQARDCVAGLEMNHLPAIDNAFLLIENGLIVDFGLDKDCPEFQAVDETIDASNKFVLPAFCDSHSHIVFASSREHEFIDKINGLTYEEVAKRGGGILNSALRLHEASEEELYVSARKRVEEMMAFGTGALEIKSGYGLNLEDELKMLRVIGRLQKDMPITIKATFLGAHALPKEYKGRQSEYVDMVCQEIMPAVAKQGIAEYFDVFCEQGFFTVEDTDKLLTVAKEYGLKPKIHANQLHVSGGVQIGVAHQAVSVDHLENSGEEEIEVLRQSHTMPTALPGCSFFSNLPYTPAKKYIEAGLPLAIASDYNPGSTPAGNMKFLVSLACIKMRLSPQQAFNAVTLNGAAAMGLAHSHGSICKGKKANLILTQEIPSIDWIPYAYQSEFIERMFYSK